jgi:photosystem II stability/assembly factor-like uncharacterized protein
VHFADAQTGQAVGMHGTILATPDGGALWEPQAGGTGKHLTSGHFADPHTGWAIGSSGTILATRNGGAATAAMRSSFRLPST